MLVHQLLLGSGSLLKRSLAALPYVTSLFSPFLIVHLRRLGKDGLQARRHLPDLVDNGADCQQAFLPNVSFQMVEEPSL